MTKPPCKCRAYPFPHRLWGGKCWDQYQDDIYRPFTCLTSYERGVDERSEDRQRASHINAVNRGAAK